MAEEQSLAGQFDKLDAAISRDIERRRKTSFIYWALLFLTAAVAVLVIFVGRSELETITDALTNDAEVIDAIAESKPVRTAVRGEVQNIAQSDEFAARCWPPTLSLLRSNHQRSRQPQIMCVNPLFSP